MTEGSRRVFDFLRANAGVKLTHKDIMKALDVSAGTVTGAVNGLVKKGRAVRTEETGVDAEGKEQVVKYISLTDEGMAFDPDAETAAKADAE